MKIYITFGQVHTHRVNRHTLDKDCVAVINCGTYEEGRTLAFDWFRGRFHHSYTEKDLTPEILAYYPRGLIEIN